MEEGVVMDFDAEKEGITDVFNYIFSNGCVGDGCLIVYRKHGNKAEHLSEMLKRIGCNVYGYESNNKSVTFKLAEDIIKTLNKPVRFIVTIKQDSKIRYKKLYD